MFIETVLFILNHSATLQYDILYYFQYHLLHYVRHYFKLYLIYHFFCRFFISPCLSPISVRRSSSTYSTFSSVSIFLQSINAIPIFAINVPCNIFLFAFILNLTQRDSAPEKTAPVPFCWNSCLRINRYILHSIFLLILEKGHRKNIVYL